MSSKMSQLRDHLLSNVDGALAAGTRLWNGPRSRRWLGTNSRNWRWNCELGSYLSIVNDLSLSIVPGNPPTTCSDGSPRKVEAWYQSYDRWAPPDIMTHSHFHRKNAVIKGALSTNNNSPGTEKEHLRVAMLSDSFGEPWSYFIPVESIIIATRPNYYNRSPDLHYIITFPLVCWHDEERQCGLRAIDRRLKHARSELERNKTLRIRHRAKTDYVFTWKGTKHFPGISKSNAKYRNRISYLRIRRRAKTEVIQY